jgi:hypothetical protein
MFRSKAPRITDVVVVTLLLLAAAAGAPHFGCARIRSKFRQHLASHHLFNVTF